MDDDSRIVSLIAVLYGERASRGVDPDWRQTYERYVRKVWAQYISNSRLIEIPAPRTIVVNTPFARPQSLSITGREFIVYDQHLGLILTMLTQHCTAPSPPTSRQNWVLFDRLLAERFLLRGRFRDCAIFAFESHALAQLVKENEGMLVDRSDDIRVGVGVQEIFTIAHELAHTLVRVSSEFRRQSERAVDVALWNMRERRSQFSDADADNAKAAGERAFVQLLEKYKTNYPGAPAPDFDTNYMPDASDHPDALRLFQAQPEDIIANDSVLMEECLCDLQAVHVTYEACKGMRIPEPLATRNILWGLLNLRVFDFMDRLATVGDHFREPRVDAMLVVAVRARFLRSVIGSLYFDITRARPEREDFAARLTYLRGFIQKAFGQQLQWQEDAALDVLDDAFDRWAERISIPLMYSYHQLIPQVRKSAEQHLKEYVDEWDEGNPDRMRERLGFHGAL